MTSGAATAARWWWRSHPPVTPAAFVARPFQFDRAGRAKRGEIFCGRPVVGEGRQPGMITDRGGDAGNCFGVFHDNSFAFLAPNARA